MTANIPPVKFGDTERFQLSLSWLSDDEPAEMRPINHGWSMGKLEISVAGVSLTAHRVDQTQQSDLIWYLGPLLHWLADNWIPLLHEEDYPWPESSPAPAAEVYHEALARFSAIGSEARKQLEAADAWYRRHALATAAEGGLFPDIFIRRFGDEIELSWSAAAPPFAPEGFSFITEPGVVRMPVDDIAKPLWQLLNWVRQNPPQLELPGFQEDWAGLAQKVDDIETTAPEQFNAAAIAEELLRRVTASFKRLRREDLLRPKIADNAPYVQVEAPAVAMFGGLSVNLADSDIRIMRDILIAATAGEPSQALAELVENAPLQLRPWQNGYDLAENLLEELEERGFDIASQGYVDVKGICELLNIRIINKRFNTKTIRGVALAGDGYAPSIVINTHSPFNLQSDGRRFTMAHELCHVLYDQSRARRLTHTSGPWAAPGVEKRANAFAAWLLMPPKIIQSALVSSNTIDAPALKALAASVRVADSAVVEHLYNLNIIDEYTREDLRRHTRH